jgi:hypothetical protein
MRLLAPWEETIDPETVTGGDWRGLADRLPFSLALAHCVPPPPCQDRGAVHVDVVSERRVQFQEPLGGCQFDHTVARQGVPIATEKKTTIFTEAFVQ